MDFPQSISLTATLDVQAGADTGDPGAPGLPRFTLIAYTGGPMRLLGWRYPVVVDLAGLAIPSQSRPIRDGHDANWSIATGVIGSADLADGSIVAIDLCDGAVTTCKLANGAVTDMKIDASAVQTVHIAARSDAHPLGEHHRLAPLQVLDGGDDSRLVAYVHQQASLLAWAPLLIPRTTGWRIPISPVKTIS